MNNVGTTNKLELDNYDEVILTDIILQKDLLFENADVVPQDFDFKFGLLLSPFEQRPGKFVNVFDNDQYKVNVIPLFNESGTVPAEDEFNDIQMYRFEINKSLSLNSTNSTLLNIFATVGFINFESFDIEDLGSTLRIFANFKAKLKQSN